MFPSFGSILAEYSRTTCFACYGCGQVIARNILRIGYIVNLPNQNHSNQTWYHLPCLKAPPIQLMHLGYRDIKGISEIGIIDRRRLKQAFTLAKRLNKEVLQEQDEIEEKINHRKRKVLSPTQYTKEELKKKMEAIYQQNMKAEQKREQLKEESKNVIKPVKLEGWHGQLEKCDRIDKVENIQEIFENMISSVNYLKADVEMKREQINKSKSRIENKSLSETQQSKYENNKNYQTSKNDPKQEEQNNFETKKNRNDKFIEQKTRLQQIVRQLQTDVEKQQPTIVSQSWIQKNEQIIKLDRQQNNDINFQQKEIDIIKIDVDPPKLNIRLLKPRLKALMKQLPSRSQSPVREQMKQVNKAPNFWTDQTSSFLVKNTKSDFIDVIQEDDDDQIKINNQNQISIGLSNNFKEIDTNQKIVKNLTVQNEQSIIIQHAQLEQNGIIVDTDDEIIHADIE